MIPRASEDTVTSLLRDQLEKAGITVEPFPVVDTPAGLRKPDLMCTNGGKYPVEAKFSERDLIHAIAKVQNDYLKHHKILGIKGGFAVLYPEQLSKPAPIETVRNLTLRLQFKLVAMFPPEDTRPFTVYEETLPRIAEILAEHILRPPEHVEPRVEYVIKSLRDSAMYLLNGLMDLTGPELTTFFGGKDVFENILEYEQKRVPEHELRLAASYLLMNQLLFYHVLSRLRAEFQEIDSDVILKPADLSQYFGKVLDVDYRAVFSYNIASLIPPSFLSEVRTIIDVIKGVSPEKIGGDLLGTIFHDLIPFDVRKSVAAFYTNVNAAELLATLAIDNYDDSVADLAAGSGGLLVAAYRRKRALIEGSFSQTSHKEFVEEDLLGVDVMPFAANIAACHLALQAPRFFTNRVNIAVWDSTELEPGVTIPSVAHVKWTLRGRKPLTLYMPTEKVKGAVSLGGEEPREINLRKCDVVMMNPPFTRQERIPEGYKSVLFDRFREYEDYLDNKMGYFGFFVFLADRFTKEGGRMALVLPATVLRIISCEGIRKFLMAEYYIEFIITTWGRAAFSEATQFREILLIAKKKGNGVKPVAPTIVSLSELPRTMEEARTLAGRIKELSGKGKGAEYEGMTLRSIPNSVFEAKKSNWFSFVATSDPLMQEVFDDIIDKAAGKVILFPYDAKEFDLRHVRYQDSHGFIVREEQRAKKTIDRWYLVRETRNGLLIRNRFTQEEVEVPLGCLAYGLRRAAGTRSIDVTDSEDFVIISKFPSMGRVIEKGSPLDDWRRKVERLSTRLILAYDFDLSAPGTSALAFYSSHHLVGGKAWCIKDPSEEEGKILALWFNSSINLLQVLLNRIETRGAFMRFREWMLREFLVLDPHALSNEERSRLLLVFEKVGRERLPSLVVQLRSRHPVRQEIDMAILSILGFSSGEIERILSYLYPALVEEIDRLKSLMKG